MRSTLGILLLAFSACLTGCASKHNTNYSEVPPPSKQGQPSKPIVKPSNALTGKVVSFNAVGRFAILHFKNPIRSLTMPHQIVSDDEHAVFFAEGHIFVCQH